MDVRFSRREAAWSLLTLKPDCKTKRRLSGWLSKTRTRRIVLPATPSEVGGETVVKILLGDDFATSPGD